MSYPLARFNTLAGLHGWQTETTALDQIPGTTEAMTAVYSREVSGGSLGLGIAFGLSERTGRWGRLEDDQGFVIMGVFADDQGPDIYRYWSRVKDLDHLLANPEAIRGFITTWRLERAMEATS